MGAFAVVIVPIAEVELAAEAAFAAGAQAVVEGPLAGAVELRIGFDDAEMPPPGARLGGRWVVERVEEDDGAWWDAWRLGASPVVVGTRLTVVPPGAEAPVTTDLSVTIDPGHSFGYGSHPTSRLCLEALVRLVRPGDHVLDVGCGSGVLAIAAAHLGATAVLAVDTDPAAVEATIANAEANGAGATVRAGDATTPWDGPFAVVVANLLAGELVRLAPQLAEAAGADGVLVVSGILPERREVVERALSGSGFVVETVSERESWVALVLRRSPPSGPPLNAQNPRYVSGARQRPGCAD